MEGSDEFREIFCEPCGKIQQKTTADGFCVDCSEYLCGQCFNHHKRFKQFEHHVLQDKNSMPLDPKNTVSKYVCTSKCQVHADEVTKYICKTCDKIGCNVCMTIDHRSCDGVRYIPDEAKKSDTSVEIREFAKMIDDMIEEQTKLYVKIDQNFQLSDEMNTTACKDLEQQKDQIITFFENLYDTIKTEVVGKQVADKKVFETLLKEVSIMQTDLKNRKARLQTLEQAQQICEAFIFMKYTQAAMGKMSSDMKELSESGKEKPARYQPSLDVEELKEDIKCLGRLFTGESDQITQIESVKKKMEKELHMIRREKEDLKDVLDRTNAIAEGLKKNVNELQTCVHKEKQNNKHLKTEKENQKLDYESRLRRVHEEFSKQAGKKLQEQNADIADLRDPNRPMKLSERFGQLYDDQWTDAFERLTDKKLGVPLKDAINVLLRLLQECWTFCNNLMATQMGSLQNVFLHPVQNMANFDQKKTGFTDRPRIASNDQLSLQDLRKRVGVSPSVIEEVKLALLADSKTWDKREKKEFDKKHIEACTPYIQKCAEICWLMALRDPPLLMKMDVKQGEKLDTNIYTVFSASGQTIDFLVWPPLYNGSDGGLLSKGVAEPLRVVGKKK